MALILTISEKIMNLLELHVTKLDYKSEENGGGGREIGTLGPEGFLSVPTWTISDQICTERFNCPIMCKNPLLLQDCTLNFC